MSDHTLDLIFFILLVILQVADVYTTMRIIDKGGRELNPVLAGLMRDFGMLPAMERDAAV